MEPVTEEGDFEIMRRKVDFYGLNFYNGLYDNAEELRAREKAQKEGGNYQDRPESHPEAIRDVLHMLVEKYKVDVPIYITENGLPQDAGEGREKNLDDQERIDYVKDVLSALHETMEDGIQVKGYYMWSLLDNFEWSAGYAARYGLYYTDYQTLERIPKKSAGWYRQVIAENGFDVE